MVDGVPTLKELLKVRSAPLARLYPSMPAVIHS